MIQILVLLLSLLSSPTFAQNTTCATRPVGDSTNACASTKFVQQNIVTQIPAPTPTTLGGIKSTSAITSQWIRYCDTTGTCFQSRPAIADISGWGTGVATALGQTTNIANGIAVYDANEALAPNALYINGTSSASAAALVNASGTINYAFALGNISQGSIFRSGAATINNTGAGGSIAGAFAVNSFNQAILTANNASNYTYAGTIYIADAPSNGSNVTTSENYALYTANGKNGIFSTKGTPAVCAAYPNNYGVCEGGLVISGSQVIPAWGVTGPMLHIGTGTLNDTSSSGTVSAATGSSIQGPTFSANSSTTYTNASTLYINGDPIAGTNVTLSNAYALRVAGHSTLQSINLTGNLSQPHWAINQGIALSLGGSTYTDTTSSGSVSNTSSASISAPTFAASNSTTYTTAATMYIAGAPNAGTNVTLTNAYAFYVAAGLTRFDGGLSQPLTTPASSSAACATGQTVWDTGYIYICTATNTWKRAALSTF